MDKTVLIVYMPDLKTSQVVAIHDFLQQLMNAFEKHYCAQMQQYYKTFSEKDDNPQNEDQ
jgi:hypothetical protein